jgi:hypothetical protein
MNIPFLIAGILPAITAFIHSIAGELTTIRPLVNAEIKQIPTLELRAAFYIVTVHLFASTVMLFILAFAANQDVVMGRFLAIQFPGYGAAFLGLAVIKRVGLFQVPPMGCVLPDGWSNLLGYHAIKTIPLPAPRACAAETASLSRRCELTWLRMQTPLEGKMDPIAVAGRERKLLSVACCFRNIALVIANVVFR